MIDLELLSILSLNFIIEDAYFELKHTIHHDVAPYSPFVPFVICALRVVPPVEEIAPECSFFTPSCQ